ncbi:hypothetical protein LguiA_006521 [Lonicera macranthoides]
MLSRTHGANMTSFKEEKGKATKLAKRSKDKASAIVSEEASLKHSKKTDVEYLHYARQNYESKIQMAAKMQDIGRFKIILNRHVTYR